MTEKTFLALMHELRKTSSTIFKIEYALAAQETALDAIIDGWADTLISTLFDPDEQWEDATFDLFWELIFAEKEPSDEQFLKFYKENM